MLRKRLTFEVSEMYSLKFHTVITTEIVRDPETQKRVDVRLSNCFTILLQYHDTTVFRYNKYSLSLKHSGKDNVRDNAI